MKFSSHVVLSTILAVVLGIFICSGSGAQMLEITSRTGLGGTDLVNWSQFGPTNTTLTGLSNYISNNGLTGQIGDSSAASLEILQQENGWSGNFTQGDYALYDQGSGSNLNISFSTPVSAAGANIMSNPYGFFNATITAYDSSSNLLATYTELGNSNGNNDGSAIFLGVSSPTSNISLIKYTTDTSVNSTYPGFAINQLGIRQNPSTAVPEPGDLAFLLAGFLPGLAFLMKRRYAKAV